MKQLLLLLLSVSLGFAALSCKDRDTEKTSKSTQFNFRKTTWGMSRDQVKASEDTKPTGEKQEVITFRDALAGIPAIVGYIFDGGKLIRAGYLMRGTHDNPDQYVKDYDKVKTLMIKRYGAPAQDEMLWKEGVKQSQDPGQFGKDACNGDLTYITIWTDGVTMIKERLSGEGGICKHGVMFDSVDLFLNKPAAEKGADVASPAN